MFGRLVKFIHGGSSARFLTIGTLLWVLLSSPAYGGADQATITAVDGDVLGAGQVGTMTSESSGGGESGVSQQSLPGGATNGNSAGTTALPDLFTGSMSYTIPIEVPPGRNGMQPELALVYRSSNGNGWLGVGWELEVGSIERGTRNGVDYGSDDAFVFRTAGSAIDLVKVGEGDYRTKIEGSFVRFQKLPGDDGEYWLATDKLGKKYYFGQTAGARQDDPQTAGRIFKWCLSKEGDLNGNSVNYFYEKDQGQIYLSEINYNEHSVYFHFGSRTDSFVSYLSNFKVTVAKSLKTIDISANGKRVRTYALGYQESPDTRRLRLFKLRKYGSDAQLDMDGNVTSGQFWPDQLIEYHEDSPGLIPPDINNPALPAKIGGYDTSHSTFRMIGDFNGDGRTDYMYMPANGDGRWLIAYGTANGLSQPNYSDVALPAILDGFQTRPSDPANRFVADFNGDGKTDYMYMPANGDGRWLIAYGSEDGLSQPTYGSPALPSSLGGFQTRPSVISNKVVGDFNSDGKSDYMYMPANGDGRWLIAYGTANGLSQPNYSDMALPAMLDGFQTRPSNPANRFVADFNGDGKADYMYMPANGDGRWLIAYGSENGLSQPTYDSPALPSSVGGYQTRPSGETNQFVADFNGDGKDDYMYMPANGNGRWLIAFGAGTGLSHPDYGGYALAAVVGGYFTRPSDTYPQHKHVGDFNGDGKADYMYKPANGDGRWLIAYGNGIGLQPPDYNEPALAATVDGHATWATALQHIGDFNGDSKADYFYLPVTGNFRWLIAYSKTSGHHPDLLSSLSNGFSGRISVQYVTSANWLNSQLPFPVSTVSSVSVDDGNNLVGTTTYEYSDGYFHIGESDFRGFNYVRVTGPEGPGGEQSISETWFHQGNDIEVDVNDPKVSDGYMKGKPYLARISDGAGNIYSEVTTTYREDEVVPFFNPPIDVVTVIKDGNASSVTTRVAYEYDEYGNVKREVNYGDVDVPGDEFTIVREYAENAAAWIVGLPSRETIYEGTTTGGDPLSQTEYYYDGLDDCSEPTDNTVPTLGRLTTVKRWLKYEEGPEAWLFTLMGYDQFGNLVCQRDPRGNTSNISYDSTNTFPVIKLSPSLPDGLRFEERTEYYGVDGVPADKGSYGQIKSVTDPNGGKFTFEYDTLGRTTFERLSDGSYTQRNYNFTGIVGSQYISQQHSPTGIKTYTYIDGQQRAIRELKTGSADKMIETRTDYDARGAVYRSWVPVFNGTEPTQFTQFAYDPIGRLVGVTLPDLTEERACYDDKVTVRIDANNHRKRETRDAYGRLVKVEEYEGEWLGDCTSVVGTPYATTVYQAVEKLFTQTLDFTMSGNLILL